MNQQLQTVKAAPVQGHSFEPQNIEEAMKLADMLSNSGLVPSALRNKPADVLVVLMKGRELGLSPMASMGNIHVIEGKATLSSDLIQGLVLKSGKCEYFKLVEGTATVARYATKRTDAPGETVMEFTIEDAKLAGLLNKDNWRKYPKAMLRARCAADLLREVYPDVCAGLCDTDEADDIRQSSMSPREVAVEKATAGRPKDTNSLKDALREKLAPGANVGRVIEASKATQQEAAARYSQALADEVPARAQAKAEMEEVEDDDPFGMGEGTPLPSPAVVQPEPMDPRAFLTDPENWTRDVCHPNSLAVTSRLKLGQSMGETWGTWEEWANKHWWKGKHSGKYTPAQVILGGKGGGRHAIVKSVVDYALKSIAEGRPLESIGSPAIVADYCLAMMEHRYELMESVGLNPETAGDVEGTES